MNDKIQNLLDRIGKVEGDLYRCLSAVRELHDLREKDRAELREISLAYAALVENFTTHMIATAPHGLLTTQQAAQALGIVVGTLHNRASFAGIKPEKIELGKALWSREQVEAIGKVRINRAKGGKEPRPNKLTAAERLAARLPE